MYFSVKQPVKIAGKVFQPCICYEVTPFYELNINKLVGDGKAVLYSDEVFFQNGKVIENKTIPPDPVAEEIKDEKPFKKAKKEKIEIKEEIPVEEAKEDETEGF